MSCSSITEHETVRVDRRRFLRLGALGGGASLLALALLGGAAQAAHNTEALLLTCMDFRLIDKTEHYMAGRGLREEYDQVILAGAALGALTDKHAAWNRTFWEHLDLSIQLHHIHKVIVMDHRDCGAYKLILGEDFARDHARETAIHADKLKELRKQIHAKYPNLEVELLLMSLDGKVEKIT
jgi:carbonic anhydrase